MKKYGFLTVIVLAVFVLALAGQALAAPKADAGIKVHVNGGRVYFPDEPPWFDAQANRVLVPLRFVSQALGAEVDWNEKEQAVTVERGQVTVRLVIGNRTVTRNGQPLTLDVAPYLTKKGRTLVPLRFVSEALGAKVEWNQAERAVYITDSGAPKPPSNPAGDGVPANAVRVTSLDQFKFNFEPIGWSMIDPAKVKVYQAEVAAADLPQPCDELGNVYAIEIDRAKFTQYEQPAIKVTVDNDEAVNLIIVANGGRDVRYRQMDTSVQTSDGRWVLYFCGNEKKDLNLGDGPALPLLRPEDVDYFGLDTVGYYGNDIGVVLWIKNPYKNGG